MSVIPRWRNCIVAGAGPSLTPEVAERCKGYPIIAVNDAWRRLPFADVLYACDQKFWDYKTPDFKGEKWTAYNEELCHENADCARRHGLKIINGEHRHDDGFSFIPGVIHFGISSGFQAVNLALVEFGVKHIVMVGFDLRWDPTGRPSHFFGKHQPPLTEPDELFFSLSLDAFNIASKSLPVDVRIVNATPNSALTCFTMMSLDDALADLDDRLHRDRSVAHA